MRNTQILKAENGIKVRVQQGEPWALSFKVYPKGASEDRIAQDFDLPGYHGNPGAVFVSRGSIHCGRTRTLVNQFSGLDV